MNFYGVTSTSKKQAERAQRESEREFRSFWQHTKIFSCTGSDNLYVTPTRFSYDRTTHRSEVVGRRCYHVLQQFESPVRSCL